MDRIGTDTTGKTDLLTFNEKARDVSTPFVMEEDPFTEWMARHLVAIAGTFHRLGRDGEPEGEEQLFCLTGFVVIFLERWWYVTAGHNFGDVLGEYVDKKQIRINKCSLLDYFAPDAKVRMATPFYYGDEPRFFMDDKALGVDVALMPLRDYYRDHLTANNVVPFERKHWINTESMDFDAYAMIGFPSELSKPLHREGDNGPQIGKEIAATFLIVKKLQAAPDDLEIPGQGWFIGRVSVPFSIKGMSGGPIFGFRKRPDGQSEYRLVAIQSRWFSESQVVLACPVSPFMSAIERTIEKGSNDAK